MTVDVSFIDARIIRYLRNRTLHHDALYWTHMLEFHWQNVHEEQSCNASTDTCWQLVTTDDAQALYVKLHDDRDVATIVRARIVAEEPRIFHDSRSGERREMRERAISAQESERVRRYLEHGNQAFRIYPALLDKRPRDPGTSLGRGFPEEPAF